jgi:uncharacterized membrane protein
MHYYEHHKRSVAKALGFHALIILADMVVVFGITHQYQITISIILFTNLISGLIYFAHERAWNRIHWGRSKVEIDI